MKTVIRLALFVVALLWVVDLPKIQAVNPPPDGGYPGFNTAEGSSALKNLTNGVANAALGWYSLFSDTAGSYNTAVGAGTLLLTSETQVPAKGRKIRPSVRQRSYSTPPALKIRRLARALL
jgi:hypothetical protein